MVRGIRGTGNVIATAGIVAALTIFARRAAVRSTAAGRVHRRRGQFSDIAVVRATSMVPAAVFLHRRPHLVADQTSWRLSSFGSMAIDPRVDARLP